MGLWKKILKPGSQRCGHLLSHSECSKLTLTNSTTHFTSFHSIQIANHNRYHPRLATSPFSPLDNYPRYHPDAASSQVEGEDEQKKKVELLFETEPSAPGPCTISSSQMNSSTKFFFNATEAGISVNRELRSGVNVGSTRHIEVAIAGTSLRYETADNLAGQWVAKDRLTNNAPLLCLTISWLVLSAGCCVQRVAVCCCLMMLFDA